MKLVRGLLLGILLSLLTQTSLADQVALPDGIYAEFTTPRGLVTCELFYLKAPLTVTSFVGLAEGTLGPAPRKPFFDGLTFHRVAPGFVVQGGDPLGTGAGGPGYKFPDEFVRGLRHDSAGILSMANSGPDSNGSQFFLTLAPVNRLNYLHSVFGRTINGLEVLARIEPGDVMSVKILRQGTAAKNFRADDKTFAALCKAAPRARVQAFEDPAGLLQTDPPRAAALNTKLENFARFTGISLYARLFEKFEAEHRNETPSRFAESLSATLQVGEKKVLLVWFATENQWHLVAPEYPALKIPVLSPWPALSAHPAPSTEQRNLDSKRRLFSALNEVLDSLIFQLEAHQVTVRTPRLPA